MQLLHFTCPHSMHGLNQPCHASCAPTLLNNPAAYQIEGAHDVGGKGPSIWDHYCAQEGNIKEGHTGEIACDHYNKVADDVKLMQSLGLKNYRLSISWPRIQPTGNCRSLV
jgi:beta-glucosidase/6-phospho-beta-glucosidase/beta-galactosidase